MESDFNWLDASMELEYVAENGGLPESDSELERFAREIAEGINMEGRYGLRSLSEYNDVLNRRRPTEEDQGDRTVARLSEIPSAFSGSNTLSCQGVVNGVSFLNHQLGEQGEDFEYTIHYNEKLDDGMAEFRFPHISMSNDNLEVMPPQRDYDNNESITEDQLFDLNVFRLAKEMHEGRETSISNQSMYHITDSLLKSYDENNESSFSYLRRMASSANNYFDKASYEEETGGVAVDGDDFDPSDVTGSL